MTTPRRRLVRPRAIIPQEEVQHQRQQHKLRARLDKERVALARWLCRLRRSFHAFERLQQTIARLERQIARLEE